MFITCSWKWQNLCYIVKLKHISQRILINIEKRRMCLFSRKGKTWPKMQGKFRAQGKRESEKTERGVYLKGLPDNWQSQMTICQVSMFHTAKQLFYPSLSVFLSIFFTMPRNSYTIRLNHTVEPLLTPFRSKITHSPANISTVHFLNAELQRMKWIIAWFIILVLLPFFPIRPTSLHRLYCLLR